MPILCNNGITIPTLETDPCNGERMSAGCLIDESLYSELGLSANATQQEINQAIYLAYLNLKATTENIEESVVLLDDFQLKNIPDDTDVASALNEGKLRYRTDANNSYVDMCMKVGVGIYAWQNVMSNNWV